MVRYLVALSIALLAAAPTAAAPPVRELYVHATEQEQAVRVELSAPNSSPAVLKNIRKTIASYEMLVRRHPISAYSDNALWQAGRLALDAYDAFAEVRDKDTGLRLLRWLVSEYPASRLARQAEAVLTERDARIAPRHETAAPAITTAPEPAAEPAVRIPSTAPNATGAAAAVIGARSAATALKPATITAIRRAVLSDVVRVTIALDAEVLFHDERIDGPARIFIDFPSTRPAASLADRTLRFDDETSLVRQVRVGRHPNMTTRVVLDAIGVSSYSVYPLYNPYRLVIDCIRATAPAPRTPALEASAAPLPARPLRTRPELAIRARQPDPIERPPVVVRTLASHRIIPMLGSLPTFSPLATAVISAARVPPLERRMLAPVAGQSVAAATPAASVAIVQALAAAAPSVSTRAAPPEPPMTTAGATTAAPSTTAVASTTTTASATTTAPSTTTGPSSSSASSAPSASSLSMARQLGLGVSRIVIDPGHGGHDPGAKGKGGVTEAELVLDVSLRLQKLLEKVRGVEVILTRQTDCFVALQERTAIANREGADLFLSIHANASANDEARGVETYFLNFANNLGAAAVAARENAASGQAMGALPDFVKAIALNNKLDESRDFAALVQQSLIDRLRGTNKSLKNLGVKQAPFVVLIGASMPSVLAEISFVTNPQEAKLLKNSAYRQAIAESLFNAVRKYQTSLTQPRRVAAQ